MKNMYSDPGQRHEEIDDPADEMLGLADVLVAGEQARELGIAIDECPYPGETRDVRAWIHGWCDRDMVLLHNPAQH